MSTRRIGTFTNLSPIQEISINPFSELNSDNINKLTKSITNGKDGVIFGLDVVNPNWYRDSIKHYDFIKDESYIVNGEWSYDRDHCTITDPEGNITNIKIEDITKCCVQKVNYIVSLESLGLSDIKGQNIQANFKLSFHIVSGCPKRIYGCINNFNNYIEYPDNTIRIHTINIPYNFADGNDILNIKLMFVLDPSDTYTDHIIKSNSYNGQSYIEINNICYEMDIINLKDVFYRIKDNHTEDGYPTVYVHPTHQLDITNGIAIKDDALIDIKDKNKEKFIPLSLDLNSNKSWIKNNPYTLDDFDDGGGLQKGFVYNRTELYDPYKLTDGTINTTTNELEFIYNTHIFNLCDEYNLTSNDYQLNFDITGNLITIEEQSITTDIPLIYGNIGYVYSKTTNNIIKKFDLIYNSETKQVSTTVVDLSNELNNSNITRNNIGVVLSAGPIKVPGSSSIINKNMIKWGYVVLYYTYYKNPKPNKAYIGLIREEDLNDLKYIEDYLILAKVRFISPNTVDIISYENRQQIYSSTEKAINISYSDNLSDEEKNLWINLGIKNIPTTVSDALTTLIRWIPLWIQKGESIIDDIIYNMSGKFINNTIIKWIKKSDNTGELVSTEYNLDPTIKSSFTFAAWNKDLNTIVQKIIEGQNGQILFFDDSEDCNVKCDWIMNDFKRVYICKTQDDLDKCLRSDSIVPSLRQLHESYPKFGHAVKYFNGTNYTVNDHVPTNNTQYTRSQYRKDPDYRGEVTTFRWNDTLNSMTTSANTIDYCGFVTKNKYREYDITYRYFSASGDDDWAGFVAAFAEDSDGVQHTLSFIRSPNNSNPVGAKQVSHWFVCIDKYSFHIPEWLGYNDDRNYFYQKILFNGDDKVNGSEKDSYGHWSTLGGNSGGVKIRVSRNGNVFKGYTSYFIKNATSAGDIIEDTEITIDLDSILSDTRFEKYWDIIRLFTKECSYGFSTQSQPGIAFECLNVINYDYVILDLVNNRVLTYNYGLQEWVEVDKRIFDFYRYGQFSYNTITKKLFWCDGNGEITELNNTSVSSLEQIYPVGSIYIGTQEKCPFENLFGTWVKVSQGKCLWGAEDTPSENKKPGKTIDAGLPNITGTIPSVDDVNNTGGHFNNTSGAFSRLSENTAGGESINTAVDNDIYEFDASKSNSIYGKSDTVQPPAFIVNIWMRSE